MKRVRVICLVSLFVISAHHTANAEDYVRIGAVFGMSGNVARYGEWALNGAQLAANEFNAANTLAGKTIQIVVEDSEGQPSKAVAGFQKLRNIDNVDYVMTFLSSVALALAPLANRARVVQMDVSATTPLYSSPNDYTFRTGAVATQIAADSARALTESFHVRAIACLYIENDFGQGMFDVFKEKFRGNILSTQTFRAGDSDFRPQLLKLKTTKVRDIWLVGHLRESGMILAQARDLGITATFYSDSYSVEGPDFLTAAKGRSDGLIYFGPAFDTQSANPSVQKFVVAYRGRYGEDPSYFAAQAYDGLKALGLAMKSCAQLSPQCVKENLNKVEFDGASGHIRFDSNGDVVKEIREKTIKNGEFVFYQ